MFLLLHCIVGVWFQLAGIGVQVPLLSIISSANKRFSLPSIWAAIITVQLSLLLSLDMVRSSCVSAVTSIEAYSLGQLSLAGFR